MTQEIITVETLMQVAAVVETLLLEGKDGINFGYKNNPEGLKVSISANSTPTTQGLIVDVTMSNPLSPKPEKVEKNELKKRLTVDVNQERFDFVAAEKELSQKIMAVDERLSGVSITAHGNTVTTGDMHIGGGAISAAQSKAVVEV
jgi:hypothetical protein